MTAITETTANNVIVSNEDRTEKRLPLPTERAINNAPGQGWLVPTSVKTSNIPEAGNGRFANIDIPKDIIIMHKPIVKMSEVSSILDVASDEVLKFHDKKDIEKFIKLYEDEGNRARKDVFEYMTHYIFSLSTSKGVTLNFSSAAVNHGEPGMTENTLSYEADGIHLFKTVADVKAGDELLVNYKRYDYNESGSFWLDFCKSEGVNDLFTNMD